MRDFRLSEAFLRSQRQGKKVKKSELAEKLWPNTPEPTIGYSEWEEKKLANSTNYFPSTERTLMGDFKPDAE